MHARPPAAADRKRENRKARKLRRAERIASGLNVAPVEFDNPMVEFLIDTHWLDVADSNDRVKVGAAVAAMWRSAIPK